MMKRVILLALVIGVLAVLSPGASATAKSLLNMSFVAEVDTTHAFAGNGSGGTSPTNSMITGTDGYLYGTTWYDGSNGNGTFYKVIPSWSTPSYSVLHSFATSEGEYCFGKLAKDNSGYIYGTCEVGGTYGSGSVYRINTSNGAVTILHHFGSVSNDGAYPVSGVVIDGSGNLYGTTMKGGTSCPGSWPDDCRGTIYKLTYSSGSYTYSVLHNFTGGTNAGEVPGSITLGSDGKLYGTTWYGGTNGDGLIFRYASSSMSKIQDLPFQGWVQYGGLTQIPTSFTSGVMEFWGVTMSDSDDGCGDIYKIRDVGGGSFNYTTMHSFDCANGALEGGSSWGDLVFSANLDPHGLDAGGALYGTTMLGGQIGGGSLFRIDLSGSFLDPHDDLSIWSDNLDFSLWGLVQGSISGTPVLFGSAQGGGANNTGWLWHFWWYV